MGARQDRAEQRMLWLLRKMARHGGRGFIVAWEEHTVDAFVEAFPEAERALRIYTLGPNVSPMLNRAAVRARDLGYIVPGVVGNMDARSYNMRTWCRTWTLTKAGRARLENELPTSKDDSDDWYSCVQLDETARHAGGSEAGVMDESRRLAMRRAHA